MLILRHIVEYRESVLILGNILYQLIAIGPFRCSVDDPDIGVVSMRMSVENKMAKISGE